MKFFLMMAFISLLTGFFLSRFFLSGKNQPILQKREITSTKNLPKTFVLKEKTVNKKLSDKKIAILQLIIGSSEIFQKNPIERDKTIDQIRDLFHSNPDDSFLALKEIFDGGYLNADPILKGSLLIQAALIKGKESEVREMALNAIFSEEIPKEKNLNELLSEEEINRELSDDPRILGISEYYDAFLASTIGDEDQIFNKSLEIIEAQQNVNVQRMIAKKYLETFPNNGLTFWDFLKNRNIELMPKGGKITIKGITYE